jgi:hypothetical protein
MKQITKFRTKPKKWIDEAKTAISEQVTQCLSRGFALPFTVESLDRTNWIQQKFTGMNTSMATGYSIDTDSVIE